MRCELTGSVTTSSAAAPCRWAVHVFVQAFACSVNPRAVERRVRIVLARLVIEHQDRLAPHVHAGVVVVAELGCGDAVAGKDDVERQLEPGRGIRKGDGQRREARFLAGAPHGKH